MTALNKKLGLLTLACVMAFSTACSRKAETKAPANDPAPVIQVLPQLPAAEPEAPEPEVQVPTAPAINMAPASAFINEIAAALKSAGYTGRQSLDPTAQKPAAEATDENAPEAPDPTSTARNGFTGAPKNLFITTPAVFRGEVYPGQSDEAWVQEITVLGDIRVTQPADKDDNGKEIPARRYGSYLYVTVSSDDDAKSIQDVKITVHESWGYISGKTITHGIDDLSAEEQAKLAGGEDETLQDASKEFTWHERGQALGAISDWIRDNTGAAQAKAGPAADKVATSWVLEAQEQQAQQDASDAAVRHAAAAKTQSAQQTWQHNNPPSESKFCYGVCSGPHLDISTGKIKMFGTGPGIKF